MCRGDAYELWTFRVKDRRTVERTGYQVLVRIPFAKSWIFRGQILTDIAEMNFKGWTQI